MLHIFPFKNNLILYYYFLILNNEKATIDFS